MPKLSTSPRVKSRIRILLKGILEHVNAGMAAPDYRPETFEYRWVDEDTSCPKLVIKTKLPFLAELIATESALPVSKDHVREVLLVLQKKLCILEDNRLKTRGSDAWDFTLKLWHTSTDRNLHKFDQAWEQYKAGKRRYLLSETSRPEAAASYLQQPEKVQQRHNLTLRLDSHFIDAQSVLSNLLSSLAGKSADAITSIVGPGGIGKTTLALEVAHQCLVTKQSSLENLRTTELEVPEFEVIIFVSAQPEEFLGPYLSERWQADRSLKDIIREILKTVDRVEGAPYDLDRQIEYVHSILKEQKTLLILDNLETVDNPKRLLAFVRTLPQTVKVILTSRTRFGIGKTIELDYLSTEAGFSLITHQARKKLVSLEFSQIKEIYQLSGGLPLAMAYSIGYLSVHRHLPELTRAQSNQAPSEIARYCVEASLKQLNNPSAQKLLMAATLFTGKFSGEAAIYIADPDNPSTNISREFSNLYRLSLVDELDSNYYSIHSFTQDFVRANLERDLPLKQALQARWIEWYQNLLQPLIDNWLDWQDYEELEAEWNNVRSLVNWCIETERYEAFQSLWLGLRGYTLFRGYWEERQEWTDEFIKMAKERNDDTVMLEAIFYKAQTLVHLDDTDTQGEALTLLKRVWQQGKNVGPNTRFGALAYISAIYLQTQQYDKAEQWLQRTSEISDASEYSQKQHQCVFFYYSAEIALQQEELSTAEAAYRQALAFAEETKWTKQIVYIRGGLATLLLHQNKLDEAEQLLAFVIEAANQHKDKRCMAKTCLNFALIAEKRGHRQDFQKWTNRAEREFRNLGMTIAANQMLEWLKNKSSDH